MVSSRKQYACCIFIEIVDFRIGIILSNKHIHIKQKAIKNNKNEKYPETKRHNPYKKARKQKYFNKFFILLIEVLQLILRFHLQSGMKR